jgi:actin related protein 2/3 complex, subunit 1A/1B
MSCWYSFLPPIRLLLVRSRPTPTIWGEKLPFNTLCGEFASPAGGWVHTVGFSPSGDVLAFASQYHFLHHCDYYADTHGLFTGHDSSVSVVYPGEGGAVFNIRISTLPFVTLTWTSEDSIVAAGHDCQPVVFSGSAGGWQAIGSLDDVSAPKSSGGGRSGFGGAAPVGRLNSAAFATFRNADSRGQMNVHGSAGGGSSTDTELMTVHQNTITCVRPYETRGGQVTRVSTTGVDGRLVIWKVNAASGGGVSAMSHVGGKHLR